MTAIGLFCWVIFIIIIFKHLLGTFFFLTFTKKLGITSLSQNNVKKYSVSSQASDAIQSN